MDKNNISIKMIAFSLIAAVILSSCAAVTGTVAPATQAAPVVSSSQGGASTAVATNTSSATATEVPTETSTAVPTAAPTVPATAAPTESVTPVSQGAAQVIPTLNAYCRKGPGAGYHAITFLIKGTAYNVMGRDSASSWWHIQAPGSVTCWVADIDVTRQGAVEQVAVAQAPALPGMPVPFVSSYVCDTSNRTLGVSLNWAAAPNVVGYRIFRNGTQVADVDATMTSYHDDAPLGISLVYEIQAYNDNGEAPILSTNVPSCG
jgi:uncharacterized protein YgiM (DUF1202 family)